MVASLYTAATVQSIISGITLIHNICALRTDAAKRIPLLGNRTQAMLYETPQHLSHGHAHAHLRRLLQHFMTGNETFACTIHAKFKK